MKYFLYIITNKNNTVLYIGITNNLKRRMYQHKNKVHPNTLSARYNLYKLIYYELFDSKAEALKRERQMKKWNRQWKINLIEKENPKWLDLIQENKV